MEKTENGEKPFWNGFSHSQKISRPYQNTDTKFTNCSQQIQGQVENFETDKSRFENVDYSHFFQATDSNLQVMDSDQYKVDSRLRNIQQEVEVDAETSERFDRKDNVYVFENTDLQENNVDGGMLVKTMKIKEEILEHQGQTLDDTFCLSQQNCDSKCEIFDFKTERNGFEIKIDNSELEFENSTISENNCVNIKMGDMKCENVTTTNEELKGTLETRGLVINGHVSSENNSHKSINRNSNVENSLSTDDNCNFKSDLTKLNINICASDNEAICLMNQKINEISDPYNSQCHSVHSDKFKKQAKNGSNVCPYACTICRTQFKLEIFVNKHMVVHETDRPHMTSTPFKNLKLCGSSLGSLIDCNMGNACGKKSKTNQVHQKHMINQSTERPHQCDFCDKGFKTVTETQATRNLQQRMISHSDAKSHHCNVCDQGFKTVQSLRRHFADHKTERPHQCNACGKGFKIRGNLKRHIAIHKTERPHQCNVCGKGFKRGGHLRQHFSVHSTERPFQCSMCDKEFKSRQHLREHVTIHRTERLHQCSVCFKSFKAAGNVRKHMAVHAPKRPYQCSVCDKGFRTKQNLQQHLTVHSTERPHQCSLCDKRFKSVVDVKRHQIHHSTERPHQCNVCGQKFKSLAGLKCHRNKHCLAPYVQG